MARLIEVQNAQGASPLKVQPGDMLLFHAIAGRVQSGGDVVKPLGTFISAILINDGTVLTPAGPPNTVVFHARWSGTAMIDIVTGNPFYAPETISLQIHVDS